jgi:hypothetical protein
MEGSPITLEFERGRLGTQNITMLAPEQNKDRDRGEAEGKGAASANAGGGSAGGGSFTFKITLYRDARPLLVSLSLFSRTNVYWHSNFVSSSGVQNVLGHISLSCHPTFLSLSLPPSLPLSLCERDGV